VEGPFRAACERALGTLRDNQAPLCALLDAALRDPGVDWDWEAAARAGSKVGKAHVH
jgi:phosphatidylinositol kinase/protein kinase (PI-3  family)